MDISRHLYVRLPSDVVMKDDVVICRLKSQMTIWRENCFCFFESFSFFFIS